MLIPENLCALGDLCESLFFSSLCVLCGLNLGRMAGGAEACESGIGLCLFQTRHPIAFFPLSPFLEEFNSLEPFEDGSIFFSGGSAAAKGIVLGHACYGVCGGKGESFASFFQVEFCGSLGKPCLKKINHGFHG